MKLFDHVEQAWDPGDWRWADACDSTVLDVTCPECGSDPGQCCSTMVFPKDGSEPYAYEVSGYVHRLRDPAEDGHAEALAEYLEAQEPVGDE